MQAIEFKTFIQDQTIRLPPDVNLPDGIEVRVIVLYEAESTSKDDHLGREVPGTLPV